MARGTKRRAWKRYNRFIFWNANIICVRKGVWAKNRYPANTFKIYTERHEGENKGLDEWNRKFLRKKRAPRWTVRCSAAFVKLFAPSNDTWRGDDIKSATEKVYIIIQAPRNNSEAVYITHNQITFAISGEVLPRCFKVVELQLNGWQRRCKHLSDVLRQQVSITAIDSAGARGHIKRIKYWPNNSAAN